MAVNDSESLRPKLVFPLFPLKAMETSKWHLEMDSTGEQARRICRLKL